MATRKTKKKETADQASQEEIVFETNEEELLQFYRDMLLIRRFEERAGQMYGREGSRRTPPAADSPQR